MANRASRTGFSSSSRLLYRSSGVRLRERLLQLKQPGAVTLAGCRRRLLPFLFGQCLQRLVKLSPGVCPAAHHPDILRQLVVALVAVSVQPAGEILEEYLGVLRLPAGLVLIQDNGILSAAAGSVEPHIGFARRCPARLLQHLQRGLIPVQHSLLEQLPVQGVIHRSQPGVRGMQDLVGHGLPG